MANNEILYQGRLRIQDPAALFSRYSVTKKDLIRYGSLIKDGKEDQAIDEFVEKYMVDAAELYNATMMRYTQAAESGEMTRKDQRSMTTSVAVMSIALATLYKDNFKTFVSEALAPTVFQKFDIRTPAVQKSILDATVGEFNLLIDGAMSRTQADLINGIRTMQREMIMMNQQIRKKVFATQLLDSEVVKFREGLRKKYPQYYRAMEEGNMLMDRAGRRLKLENYADMSTRTTLLNVERTSVEVIGKVDQRKVVEYYQRDFRRLKTGIEREICKHVLKRKVDGKSLLAYDEDTAKALGIETIDQAKAQGAMGPYCRHSMRPVSKTFHRRLERQYLRGDDAE